MQTLLQTICQYPNSHESIFLHSSTLLVLQDEQHGLHHVVRRSNYVCIGEFLQETLKGSTEQGFNVHQLLSVSTCHLEL